MEIQIITLIIALFAVILGPIITYRITKKNLEFQFRTIIQEKWVNKLEDAAHSFLNSTLEWIEKYPGLMDGSSQFKKPNNEIDRMFDSINSSIIRFQLLLDTQIPDQKSILANITQMKGIVNSKKFDEDSISQIRSCHDSIVEKLKTIFQEERNKIKNIFE